MRIHVVGPRPPFIQSMVPLIKYLTNNFCLQQTQCCFVFGEPVNSDCGAGWQLLNELHPHYSPSVLVFIMLSIIDQYILGPRAADIEGVFPPCVHLHKVFV